jgi:hypothetical protein
VKLATSLAAALVLLCVGSVFAVGTGQVVDLTATQASKDAAMIGVNDPQPQQGGEDIATAANIPALPYSDSGNTCGYLNNYDEACPYTGGTSPDVVYKFSPGVDMAIDVDLCATTAYDTKVYVYENDEFTPVACNDDACGNDGWKSLVTAVPVYAGNTYYIVVDGYGSSSCGAYDMIVREFVPCVECPPDGVAEGEPDCYDYYIDLFNSGCNDPAEVFSSVPCATTPGATTTICGRGGYYLDASGFTYRDTDWYLIDSQYNTAGLLVCLTPATVQMLVGYITVTPCATSPGTFDDYVVLPMCTTGCLNVPPGDFWIWVGATGGALSDGCGHDYNLEITGYDCGSVSVEPSSWGSVKQIYR